MTSRTILRVDSSARLTNSISRQLTDAIVGKFEPARVITRDLGRDPLPLIDEGFVSVTKYTAPESLTPAQQRVIALSDSLIDEVKAADVIVIGLPIYNFGVPAVLKAWLDLIARAGQTFQYTENGPEGLLTGKRVIVVESRGGLYSEGPAMSVDFQEPYLRHLLGFVGLTDVTFVRAEKVGYGPDARAAAIAAALSAHDTCTT